MNKKSSILFLTLSTFSLTGGIEKVCRILGKTFYELCEEAGKAFFVYSLHDSNLDGKNNIYFPDKNFHGFSSNIRKFIFKSIQLKKRENIVIVLSHINLLPVGYLIKILHPGSKLLLLAHGIEIWGKQPLHKRWMLKKCDNILAVSEYTKQMILESNKIEDKKIQIVNNCLDPFLKPSSALKIKSLYSKYAIKENSQIMLCVTRYSSKEKYKGYDIVIKSLKEIEDKFPRLIYLLVGKYDEFEKERIEKIAENFGFKHKIIFTGYVSDNELPNHFKIAEVFVMPSKKEGFGIVFIEAIYYGLPVISGNADGSVDALLNGALGTMVNPENTSEIVNAIEKVLKNKEQFIPNHKLLMDHFSYTIYKDKFRTILK